MSNITYLHLRCTTIEKEVLRERAARCGMSLTAFTIAALDGKAPKAAKAASINRYLREAKPGEKTDQVQLKLPRKVKRNTKIQARRKSMTVSDFVRQIVIYGRRELLK
jgi:hypothetical protein